MAIFFRRITNIAQRLETLLPDFNSFQRLGALPLDPRMKHTQILALGLSLPLLSKILVAHRQAVGFRHRN